MRISAIIGALLCMSLSGCAINITQDSFFPSAQLKAPDAKLLAPESYILTDKLIELEGLGMVHAVFLDNPNSNKVLVYSAGNGGFANSERSSKTAEILAELCGADIILYDYPGRGGTTLPPTIPAAIAVGPQLVKQFKTLGWMGKGPAYAYGLSFGGSMASAMARNGDFAGLIIEGSASDYVKIGHDFAPPLLSPFLKIRVSDELKQFDYFGYALSAKAPILLLSAKDDDVIRQRTMRSFAKELATKGAKVTFQSTPGGHGDSLLSKEGKDALRAFITNN